MARLVSFDTMVSVWGLLGISNRDNMRLRTRALIDSLMREGRSIIITAPVLGELLAVVPPPLQKEKHDLISRFVRIYPFDSLAAEVYAEMIYNHNKNLFPEDLKKYAKDNFIPRQKVKVDYMIAAISVANNCEVLFTEDESLRKFAENYILVSGVPNKSFVETKELIRQTSLFEEEIRDQKMIQEPQNLLAEEDMSNSFDEDLLME